MNTKSIGGYFGLELPASKGSFHPDALCLNTARNALELVLLNEKTTKLFLPYYICNCVLEPLAKHGIDYEYYHVDHSFGCIFDKEISESERILYVNYYGVKTQEANRLLGIYGRKLIVDSSQSFFSKYRTGTTCFYSARKFFGVSNGAYLYYDGLVKEEFPVDESLPRAIYLLRRHDTGAESGYDDFRNNEASLNNQPIKKMSNLTRLILSTIDYNFVKSQRENNFSYLHGEVGDKNMLPTELLKSFDDSNIDVPMVYPLLVRSGSEIRNKLIQNRIYIPTYWPGIEKKLEDGDVELDFVKNLLTLPCDQRYSPDDLHAMVDILNAEI